MNNTRHALALLLLAGALTSCMKDNAARTVPKAELEKGGNAEQIQAVIDNISDNVIVASYRDLRDSTKALHQATLDLQREPTEARLQEAQARWFASRIPWEQTEGFLFGPVFSLAIDPALDSWPLAKQDLDDILKKESLIKPEFVRRLNPTVQGFHTAEYLLFGDGEATNTKPAAQLTRGQLIYLTTVSQVLAETTEMLYQAWIARHDPSDPSASAYIDIIKQPGKNNRFYSTQAKVLQEFVRGMIKIAIEVGGGKLAGPMGGDISHAQPSLVESQFSWNSLRDFQDNIASMQNVYTGDYGKHQGPGLDELVRARNAELDTRIKNEMAAAKQAIADIAGPRGVSFTHAIKDPAGRARAAVAIGALGKLERILTDDLLPLTQ